MDPIIELSRMQVRRLDRLMNKTDSPDVFRRALAVKQMGKCDTMVAVADRVEAHRSSLYRWRDWFDAEDTHGLRTDERGAPKTTVTETLKSRCQEILSHLPQHYGYAASYWTSSLLAEVLEEEFGLEVHPSTLRRLLPKLGYSWGRARHAESWRQDPEKEEKLAAIQEATNCEKPYTDVFFLDEAKIKLLPKIGFGWRPIGHQQTIVTPGQNEDHCVAGALHKDSKRLTWTDGPSHDTDLLLDLLNQLHARYKRSKKIIIIMDNAPSHTSHRTEEWFDEHDRFEVRFQPTYTPAPNKVEKVWKQLHRVVTRNHRHQTLESLMVAVRSWLEEVDIFPNSDAAQTARVDQDQIVQV